MSSPSAGEPVPEQRAPGSALCPGLEAQFPARRPGHRVSEGQGTLGRQAPPQPPSVHADYCSELLLGCSMSLRSPGTWILIKAKLIVHLRELLRSFWRHSRKKLICLEHLTTVSPKPTFPVLSPTTFPQKAETSPSPFPALAHPSHLPQETWDVSLGRGAGCAPRSRADRVSPPVSGCAAARVCTADVLAPRAELRSSPRRGELFQVFPLKEARRLSPASRGWRGVGGLDACQV